MRSCVLLHCKKQKWFEDNSANDCLANDKLAKKRLEYDKWLVDKLNIGN